MPLQALSLDFCGTLAVEVRSRAAIYAEAGAARGLAVGEKRMATLMDEAHAALPREVDGAFRYSDDWFRAFIERIFHGVLGLEHGRLTALEDELFARFSDAATFRLFPGAPELLSAAHAAGLRTLVVSNWSPRLGLILERLGLAEGLDAIVSSAEERLEKPDPALFGRALERLDVPPSAALHAGDHPDRDVAAARAAGLAAVLVDRSGTMPADGVPVVDSLPALLAHLDLE